MRSWKAAISADRILIGTKGTHWSPSLGETFSSSEESRSICRLRYKTPSCTAIRLMTFMLSSSQPRGTCTALFWLCVPLLVILTSLARRFKSRSSATSSRSPDR